MTSEAIIVGKTKAGQRQCIGALTKEGEALRLKKGDFPFWDESDGFDLYQKYRFEFRRVRNAENPHHVEDVVIVNKRLIGTCSQDEVIELLDELSLITDSEDPRDVFRHSGKNNPFTIEGNGDLIAYEQHVGVLTNSVGFWRCPERLELEDVPWERTHYCYELKGMRFKHVGFQDRVAEIPPNTILRLSTAGLWVPKAQLGIMPRKSYLQLSGWFL
jgi:hypothetical protein